MSVGGENRSVRDLSDTNSFFANFRAGCRKSSHSVADENRDHSDVGIRDSAEHHARCPTGNSVMGTLMGTLWERAQFAYAQLLNFQEEMARPERFELPTPRFVVW